MKRAAAAAVVLAAFAFPLYFALAASLAPEGSLYGGPGGGAPTLEHYRALVAERDFVTPMRNSLVVAGATTVCCVLIGSVAAYALARMRFRGRDLIFVILVGSLMIPNAVVLVPQYILTQQLGWLSTYQGLIVPEAAMTFAFGVFLLRQFFLTLPTELEDAARIDGASPWHIFTRIVLPLSQPVLGALAIFAFRSAWNDFLWPLIAVNKPEMFPLPLALALLRSAYSSESYGPIMAGATLSAIPLLVVFLLANRRIIEGVRVGGLKS